MKFEFHCPLIKPLLEYKHALSHTVYNCISCHSSWPTKPKILKNVSKNLFYTTKQHKFIQYFIFKNATLRIEPRSFLLSYIPSLLILFIYFFIFVLFF